MYEEAFNLSKNHENTTENPNGMVFNIQKTGGKLQCYYLEC
jgi:hypothetical protein